MQGKLPECAEAFASIKLKAKKNLLQSVVGFIHKDPCWPCSLTGKRDEQDLGIAYGHVLQVGMSGFMTTTTE